MDTAPLTRTDRLSQAWTQATGLPFDVGSLIAGRIFGGRGITIAVDDPATGRCLFAYHDAEEEIAELAVTTAARGYESWRGRTASQRGLVLWQAGQRIRASLEALAQLESLSCGKPLRDARVEVLKVAEMFEYYAGWADKLHGEVIPVPTSHLNYTQPVPYGVVAQITPWNAPIFTAGWQLAPALAAGNAVVLKPSELTPLSSLALGLLLIEAGVPAEAVSVLAGLGATTGTAMIAHELVRKVVFVGSPATGRLVAATAASSPKPCVLELGGKSANVVFPDADMGKAVGGAAAAIFSGAGQSCVAGSRLLVHEDCYDIFIEMLAAKARAIVLGDPLAESTQIGPINNARQLKIIEALVADAIAEGGEILTGGKRPALPSFEHGFFYEPTVVCGATNTMRIARDEVFGPVVAAIPFRDEAEAVAIANDSPFGLAGAVWTADVGRAHRIAGQLAAGTVWINSYKTISVMSPFGGFKGSGYGRSSGREGLAEYLQTRSIWTETSTRPGFAFGYG